MRTSTKIFLGAMLLLAICLGYYDWQLNTAYRKGDFTDPYYGYERLNFRDFDEIDLHSATTVNVMIVQGGYKVLAHPQAKEFVVVRQEGKRLIIETQFPDHYRGLNAAYTLFISCPTLSAFRSDAKYRVRSVDVTDFANWNPSWMGSEIRGFHLDSLSIGEDHASNLDLDSNQIKRLTAVLGAETDDNAAGAPRAGMGEAGVSEPVLTIGPGNHFDSNDLNILSKGRLRITGMNIRQLTYHLADSASLTVNGVSARYLKLY
jgi:hypothetical protein